MPTTSYTKVKVTTNAPVAFETTGGKTTISKVLPLTDSGKLKPFNLKSYKPREEQFPSGSAKRQSEILDMMISPGIVKGLKNFDGIRYLVDGFKSYFYSINRSYSSFSVILSASCGFSPSSLSRMIFLSFALSSTNVFA